MPDNTWEHFKGLSLENKTACIVRESASWLAAGRLGSLAAEMSQSAKFSTIVAGQILKDSTVTVGKDLIKASGNLGEAATEVAQDAKTLLGELAQGAQDAEYLALAGGEGSLPNAVLREGGEASSSTKAFEQSCSKQAVEDVSWGMWSDLKKVVYEGREYAKINERLYTHEAVDRMTPKGFGTAAGGYESRGIPTGVVEDTIKNGSQRIITKSGSPSRTIFESNGIRVVTEKNGSIVITTMRYGV